MKTFLLSLMIAWLFAGQLVTPAAAAPLAAAACGTTYTVQNKDTLAKIAELCGTTVAEILDLNPQIANPNLIYNGQVLLIHGRRPSAIRVTYTTTAPTTYTVKDGDTFLDIATMFGVTIWDITQANPGLTFFTKLTPGMELEIPAAKKTTSYTIYKMNTYVVYYPNARVTLSAIAAQPGDDIHVYVSDFPPGSRIDYQIGLLGNTYSYLYDGVVDEDGNASLTFEIPAAAKEGESWVIFVTTTSRKEVVSATSPIIRIDVD